MNEFRAVMDPSGVLHFVVDDPDRPLDILQCGDGASWHPGAQGWEERPEFPIPLSKVCHGCAVQIGYGATTWPDDYATA